MTSDPSPARDGWSYMARRLDELDGYARTGLVAAGEDRPPVSFWVPGELLTDDPTAVVALLARHGVPARPNPAACGTVYRIEIEEKEVCGPLLARDLDRLLGDDGFVGLNHVLTLAPVPKIGPGTDPEPAKEADWGCDPIRLPDDWRITVLDTGLFKGAPGHLAASPDTEWELVDFDGGGVVDFSGTGHGGFIAGILYRMLGHGPQVRDVATRDYDEWTFAITEADIIADIDHAIADEATKVINLSLGTYEVATDLTALRSRMRRWVEHRPDVLFVCAAGNDSTDTPFYPAAFSAEKDLAANVVAVGALDCPPDQPDPNAGKADFTNHGDWVTAWAPGVDHRSDYATDVEFVYGPDQSGFNPDRATFAGLAQWSGTSFAAPYAAAELVRYAVANGVTPQAAWSRLCSKGPVTFPLDGGPCHSAAKSATAL